MKKLLFPFLFALSLPVFADDFRNQMLQELSQIREQLPQYIGDIQRLESIDLIGNNILYTNKFLHMSRSEYDNSSRLIMQKRIFNMACTNPTLKTTLDNGYSYEYKYFDKDSKYIDTIRVTLADCANI